MYASIKHGRAGHSSLHTTNSVLNAVHTAIVPYWLTWNSRHAGFILSYQ